MFYPSSGRSFAFRIVAVVLLACVVQTTLSGSSSDTEQGKVAKEPAGMTPTKKAEALGIKFEKLEPGYLNRCVKSGKLLFTSGFGSKMKGRLGNDLKVDDGQKAARECGVEILRAVWNTHGTLDNLRVDKVLGC